MTDPLKVNFVSGNVNSDFHGDRHVRSFIRVGEHIPATGKMVPRPVDTPQPKHKRLPRMWMPKDDEWYDLTKETLIQLRDNSRFSIADLKAKLPLLDLRLKELQKHKRHTRDELVEMRTIQRKQIEFTEKLAFYEKRVEKSAWYLRDQHEIESPTKPLAPPSKVSLPRGVQAPERRRR